MNPQDLEEKVYAMGWERVSLEPAAADVQALDQELPPEWLTLREPEQAFTHEELDALMKEPLDIPAGDLNEHTRQALHELDTDMNALMQEVDVPEVGKLEQDHSTDFER